jgi:hypothetical protein
MGYETSQTCLSDIRIKVSIASFFFHHRKCGLGKMAGARNPMKSQEGTARDYEVAVQAAKLWPNRKHEANSVLGLFCRLGIHRWRRLDLSKLMPTKNILHCFWCSKVKIDGVVYDV